MNINDMSHRKWFVLECPLCKAKQYIYNSLPVTLLCNCGNTQMDIVEVEKWTAGDYVKTCHDELTNNNMEDIADMPDTLIDELSQVLDEKYLTEVMQKISDCISQYLCK